MWRIDVAKIEADASQLWAEAVVLHKRGAPHWLDSAEIEALEAASQQKLLMQTGFDEIIQSELIEMFSSF